MIPRGGGRERDPSEETHDEQDRRREASFEDLLREVLARVNGALDEQAGCGCSSTRRLDGRRPDLDGVLPRIVEIARQLADAQYAALGVLSEAPDRRLRTFVHHGMPGQVEEIGDLPTGHGILGLLIDRPRTAAAARHRRAPGVVRLPRHHPPMRRSSGCPVRIRDQVFGNLYLTEKAGGGDFTQEDEEIVVALAAAAGVAIENARLYEEAARRERWLAATAEITGLLTAGTRRGRGPADVADRAREVAAADVAWLVAGQDRRIAGLRVDSGPTADPDAMRSWRWTGRSPARWSRPGSRSRSRTSPPTPGPSTLERVSAGPASVPRSSYRCAPGPRSTARWPWRGRRERADEYHSGGPAHFRPASPSRLPWRCRSCGPARTEQRLALLRGPRPHRSRPARPGDPAAVRRRAGPAERLRG